IDERIMKWYIAVLKKYAVFSGRARRKEYWYFTLVDLLFKFVNAVITRLLSTIESAPAVMPVITFIIAVLYPLLVLVPALAVTIRRFHDTGHSAWWLLLAFIAQLSATFGGVLLFVPSEIMPTSAARIYGPVFLISTTILLIFLTQDSQAGENRFGPNPKISGGKK
ncbi:MAG: DUF805 domain-containing protein, partial [Salinispira sp.]